MTTNIMLIAGESSGDIAASQLIAACQKQYHDTHFFGIAGDLSKAEGMEVLIHCKAIAAMGTCEVIKSLFHIYNAMQLCRKMLIKKRPKLLILVDYPGFNMRLARFAKSIGIPVLYFISPKVWAWKAKRIEQLQRTVEHMAVIFPFEVPIYEEAGIPVTLVQHPSIQQSTATLDAKAFKIKHHIETKKQCICIMPGSRRSEIHSHMNLLVETIKNCSQQLPNHIFLLPIANTIAPELVKRYIPKSLETKIYCIQNDQYNAINASDVVIVASGTAALEVALLEKPLCVIYKTGWLTYTLGKHFIQVPFISLPNLILQRKAAEEWIQHDASVENLSNWLIDITTTPQKRQVLQSDMQAVRQMLSHTKNKRSIADCVGLFL